jgi:hypothetical protein
MRVTTDHTAAAETGTPIERKSDGQQRATQALLRLALALAVFTVIIGTLWRSQGGFRHTQDFLIIPMWLVSLIPEWLWGPPALSPWRALLGLSPWLIYLLLTIAVVHELRQTFGANK